MTSTAIPHEPATSDALSELAAAGFTPLEERPVPGSLRRLTTVLRHGVGLVLGALGDRPRSWPVDRRRGPKYQCARLVGWLARRPLRRALRDVPFGGQLRARLELLGPAYIKIGQILSLRRDLLPRPITDELENLLDRLPAVTFPRFQELVEEGLGRPVSSMFAWIESRPTGSASIAQIHRASTLDGDSVILKVVKPGIRAMLERDARLLRALGRVLQIFLGRYQPRRVIDELITYTLREVDLEREADNAETFAANFEDRSDIVFPRVFRAYSSSSVLCMEFFAGIRPDAPAAQQLSDADRTAIVDLGTAAIVRMLYRDGFFHADLHPANLLVLKGPRAGFIDLGMVGRFDDALRRSLLYYYYCLVTGDAQGAARYLTQIAEPLRGADVEGFRRAVAEVSQRWKRAATFHDFSLGQLVLESVSLGGQYRMIFPVEMVLMVKALVTFEGVGNLLQPGFDVAAMSRGHVTKVLLYQLSPLRLMNESLRNAPEVVEAVVKAPLLVSEGLRLLERSKQPRENPLAGVRGALFGGLCMIAGAILAAAEEPWLAGGMLTVGMLSMLLRRR